MAKNKAIRDASTGKLFRASSGKVLSTGRAGLFANNNTCYYAPPSYHVRFSSIVFRTCSAVPGGGSINVFGDVNDIDFYLPRFQLTGTLAEWRYISAAQEYLHASCFTGAGCTGTETVNFPYFIVRVFVNRIVSQFGIEAGLFPNNTNPAGRGLRIFRSTVITPTGVPQCEPVAFSHSDTTFIALTTDMCPPLLTENLTFYSDPFGRSGTADVDIGCVEAI